MRLNAKKVIQILLLNILLFSCNKDEISLNYSVETISSNPEINFHQLFFINESTGFLVGGHRWNSGTIYKTVDGGFSWNLNLNTDQSLYAINFLNDSVGFACGESLILLKTFDQGVSWEEYNFPYYPDELYTVPFKKIEFVNDTIVYLVGGMYFDRGLIAKSSNGGSWWNWDLFDYELSSSHLFNSDYGIFSGYGHFVVTQDGAQSFEVVDFDDDFFTSIYFLDAQTGYACGYDGGVYKTNNAGNQWEVLINANNLWTKRVHLNDIHMLNADKGIAVGNNGVVVVTYDGGNNWKNFDIKEGLDCNSIYHIGNDKLKICCSEGKIIQVEI